MEGRGSGVEGKSFVTRHSSLDTRHSFFPRPSTLPPRHSLYSYLQSGSSGCFKSHSGRRLRTSGKVSKLYSGGGEVVDHSSVQASQGSSPAGAPRRSDHSTLATKQPTPAT